MKKLGIVLVMLMFAMSTFAQKEKNDMKVELSVKDFYRTTDAFSLDCFGGVEYTNDAGKVIEQGAAYLFTFVFVADEAESFELKNIFQLQKDCTFNIKLNKVYLSGTGTVIDYTYRNNVVNVQVITKVLENKK